LPYCCFPDVLHSAGLDWLSQRGYHYSLWRQHPDTRQVQVLAASAHAPPALNDPVHYQINMPNGTWLLDVQPRDGWLNQQRIAINSLLVLVISGLLGWLAWQMVELRRRRAELALLVALRTRAGTGNLRPRSRRTYRAVGNHASGCPAANRLGRHSHSG
jgi:hypothetical protein